MIWPDRKGKAADLRRSAAIRAAHGALPSGLPIAGAVRAHLRLRGAVTSAPALFRHRVALFLGLAAVALLGGCSDSPSPDPLSQPSAGQVAPPAAPAKVTRYAAARFLDQTTFGATPAEMERVRRMGLAAWIDWQMSLPASAFDGRPVIAFDEANATQFVPAYNYLRNALIAPMLSAPDQLRLRVMWALSQFVPVSLVKSKPYGILEYANLLQRSAFGNYGQFLREMTIHPTMGHFLDNAENRPAGACFGCAPNENFSRELLQLFTLGVHQLNPDGTVKRDGRGRPLETYTQKDVEELTRALTGWAYAYEPGLPLTNFGNFGKTMIALGGDAHDNGPKTILGVTFPAGRSAEQELEAVVALLMAHPNIAPFVSLRLIQHLVTSDPTPAYVHRVASVFRNNGMGVAGDLKAVVKAVLLDPEARRGDAGSGDSPGFGKLREPLLFYTAMLRGVGCQRPPVNAGAPEQLVLPQDQVPFAAPSVFSFYLPTDRAPKSNLLAPEQRLLSGFEFRDRLGGFLTHQAALGPQRLVDAGCDLQPFTDALSRSMREFLDLLSERWFRGAMPAALRASLTEVAAAAPWLTGERMAVALIEFALISPYFGAIE